MDALTVSELAKRAGVNAQTIRYYEREGLLPRPPRTSGGYRAFPPDSAARVRFIKRAQELGFSLREAKELLDLRQHPDTACPQVLSRAELKLADISEKIRALRQIHRELSRLAKACAGRARPHACPLLEALESNGDQNHDDSPSQRRIRLAKPRRSRSRGPGGDTLLRRTTVPGSRGHRERVGQQTGHA